MEPIFGFAFVTSHVEPEKERLSQKILLFEHCLAWSADFFLTVVLKPFLSMTGTALKALICPLKFIQGIAWEHL